MAPLTLISGTNSAGKSSFMQPFLVMKQTLESGFDPGPLLLYGPNAKFTLGRQALSRGKSRETQARQFSVGMRSGTWSRRIEYIEGPDSFAIGSDTISVDDRELCLTETMRSSLLESRVEEFAKESDVILQGIRDRSLFPEYEKVSYSVEREGCMLDVSMSLESKQGFQLNLGSSPFELQTAAWSSMLRGIIHVPGLRGNPEREYARSATGNTFPGTFETYVASILLDWAQNAPEMLDVLSRELEALGLTWKVMGRKKNDAAVEVLVGRLPHAQQGGALDLVSVADVGFGVSQTLPVVISLLVARPGQIVYLEQPEIHLHPRAQIHLAQALVAAANRGVKVIAETHSSLLIRAVQTHIAEGSIPAKGVSMNWFSRDEQTGFSRLDVAELDEAGRFGDWPLDFDEVMQDADLAYIDAIRRRAD
ncbi:AAA family ATPase [Leifsonia sp. NPDC077715]|uniref:AAA family ATPase n=1 Tax=Leifsonia sp. NPDC077715 TaxID=3155539 RepID=UPI003422FE3C